MLPALLLLLFWLACAGRAPSPGPEREPEVRYQPAPPPTQAGRRLVEQIPGAQGDRRLLAATRALVSAASSPRARITPQAAALATARAGFPGDARFAREWNRGGFPEGLLEEVRDLARALGVGEALPLDLALASRRYPEGEVLWMVGAAPHRGDLDPTPRDLLLDDALLLHVNVPGTENLVVYVASPQGPVRRHSITDDRDRWLRGFHLPGEYRVEVVQQGVDEGTVVHRFSIFVERDPEPIPPLPDGLPEPDPEAATAWLYRELNRRRAVAGLPTLERFVPFEPLAREHSAFMAVHGSPAHVIPGVTPGVARRAWEAFHPRARHTEDLAAAYSAEDAMELVWLSPGHRANLLCEPCTHVSVGVALEPVLDVVPRLFVTWELLSFPQGIPQPVDLFEREVVPAGAGAGRAQTGSAGSGAAGAGSTTGDDSR